MNIGELAKQTGLAPSRIRFYERIGLLKTVQRLPNGYRSYPHEAILMLNLITTAQKAGFSLDELRTLLPPDLENWERDSLVEGIRRRVKDIEDMEAQLAESKTQLVKVLKQIEAKPEDVDCTTNAKRVSSQMGLGELESPAPATDEVNRKSKKQRH
ncbi:MerR family transcriptional regulator [Microbulbifer hainanensis]|uniref:MerR family transcriptional regulator n=1 Tax=Microbulbifer hainanensis TaxID=2735675 RepID=UPI0018663697|nr:MerR family transcriptional regulator [Microbulbifer hainanensis]